MKEPVSPSHCVVVGAGLAGAAAAASLARRGWQVTVLDAAAAPAAGASGLPVGMLAPHHSADDNPLSRLSRLGVRATFEQAQQLLRDGEDWHMTGVLEKRDGVELWHEHAGWLKPAALVRAWLAHEAITFRGHALVSRIVRDGDWALLDAAGHELARAPIVIVAAAHASTELLARELPLQPVRGQVSWAMEEAHGPAAQAPVKGNGHFIPHVPFADGFAWFCGSTYERGDTGIEIRASDQAANRERLRELLPEVEQQLAAAFESGAVNAWAGVRCASSNRRPIAGEIEQGLWITTAMGSRGLTFAFLCAETIAAQLHAEPLPLERKLAESISPAAQFQS